MARDYRAENLRRRYGLTPADYYHQLAIQEHCCAICKVPLDGVPLHVDHNHDTGQLRGLLCPACNLGLGHFKDDPERLAAAIVYLHKSVANQLPPGVSMAHTLRHNRY